MELPFLEELKSGAISSPRFNNAVWNPQTNPKLKIYELVSCKTRVPYNLW